MELIRKIVTIEPSRSYLPGLLPYIGQEISSGDTDGNYGELIVDIDFGKLADETYGSLSGKSIMTYSQIMRDYRWYRDFFATARYYICLRDKKVWSPIKSTEQIELYSPIDRENAKYQMSYWQRDKVDILKVKFLKTLPTTDGYKSGEVIGISPLVDEYNAKGGITYYNFIEAANGKIYIPDDVDGDLVPSFIYLMDAPDFLNDLLKLKEGDCCNNRKYRNMGGDKMVEFLKTYAEEDYITKQVEYFSKLAYDYSGHPNTFIHIPVLIDQQYDDMGMVNLIASEWEPGRRYYKGEIVFYNGRTYCCNGAENNDIWEDSGIFTMTFNDDDWTEVNAGSYHQYIDIISGIVSSATFTYIGESQLTALANERKSYDDDNNELPFLVVGSGVTYEIQDRYRKGVAFNTITYGNKVFGDVITDITKEPFSGAISGMITYEYVINGQLKKKGDNSWEYAGDGTGMRFKETYPYEERMADFYYTNDVSPNADPVRLLSAYTHVFYERNRVDIDSKTKDIILSEITYDGNAIWGKDELKEEECQTYSHTFRMESEFGLAEPIKWSSSIDIDRGNSAAFEKHLKLMEVNSMQDLVEYQNNYFNIEQQ